MLIVEGKLDIAEFKNQFQSFEWLKLPRKLGPNHTEYFYSTKYEDSSRIVKATIRPSLWMSVSESFKNRKPIDGSIPEEGYKGPVVEWGYYTEVNIDENFLNKIKEIAKSPEEREKQILSW